MTLYLPCDRETATRFFDEHVAPGCSEAWIATHRETVIREHAVWCRFERENARHKALGGGKIEQRKVAA